MRSCIPNVEVIGEVEINIRDATPHLQWVDTTASQDDFEAYADASQWYLTNVTDAIELIRFNASNNLFLRGGSVTYSWPTTDGTSGQFVSTNGSGVLSFATGSGGNSFETIAVPAGASIVAETSTDTATFTEDTFLTLTGTAAPDTIDITQVTTDLGTDGLIAANAVALGTDTTNNYVASIGNCTASESVDCFTGSDGNTLTSTTSEVLDLSVDATLTFTRNTAGTVTFIGADNATPATTIYDTTGAGTVQIGSADVAAVNVLLNDVLFTINATTAYDLYYSSSVGVLGWGDVVSCNDALCAGTASSGSVKLTSTPDSAGLFTQAYNGTFAVPTSLIANDNAGIWEAEGYNASSASWDRMGSLYFVADGEFATAGDATDSPGRLEVWTVPNGSATQALRFTIDNAGLTTALANLTIGNGATTAGILAIREDTYAGTNEATFTVPALAVDTDYTLPADDGAASEVLSTDGAGVLDWVAAGAGDITDVYNCASGDCNKNLLADGHLLNI